MIVISLVNLSHTVILLIKNTQSNNVHFTCICLSHMNLSQFASVHGMASRIAGKGRSPKGMRVEPAFCNLLQVDFLFAELSYIVLRGRSRLSIISVYLSLERHKESF